MNPIYFDTERWITINCDDIKSNMYEVSTYGNVRNINTKTLLSKPLTTDGYETVFLQTNLNQRKSYYIHRLVAVHFILNPFNKPIVHHSSYISNFNYYKYLEWVDEYEHTNLHINRGNIIYTTQTNNWARGDLTYGENNGMSIWTNEQVHNICRYVELGLSYSEALIKSGIEDTENNRYNVSHIIQGVRWKHISSLYNVSSKKYNNYSVYVEDICRLLSQNKSTSEIINIISIPTTRENARHFIGRIRRREIYKHVSDNYIW